MQDLLCLSAVPRPCAFFPSVRSRLIAALLLVVMLAPGTSFAQSAAPIPLGLANWWRAENNALDTQGNVNGTLNNGAFFTAGKVGSGFSFINATQSNITFGNSVGNFGTNDFTVDFWMQTSSSAPEAIFDKRVGCAFASFVSMRLNYDPARNNVAGRAFVELQDGVNQNSLVFDSGLDDGAFHHVAIVRQGVTVFVYVDGGLSIQQSTAGITNISNTSQFQMGQSACSGVDGTQWFQGTLDEFHIFSRALSQSEVQSIYNAGSAGLTTLVGWWKFDEGSGTTTADSSGNGNSGTLTGSTLPSWTTDVPAVSFSDPASLSFDGATSYVNVAGGSTSPALNFTTQVSITAWVKPSLVQGGTFGIVSKPRSSVGTGWTLRMESLDPDFGLDNDLVSCSVHASSNPFTAGVWTHVAATYDSSTSTVQLFVNGVQVPVDNQGCTGPLLASTIPLQIGEEFVLGGRNFPGEIDDVRVYNRVLAAAEITTLMSAASQTITFTVSAPASAAYGSMFTVAASASSGLPVTFISAGSCTNLGATYTMTSSTGTCSVIANQAGNGTYSPAPQVTQTVNATAAPLAVTATSLSKFAGDPNPTLTYTVTGFVSPDTSAVLSGAPALSTTATAASPVGSYPITITKGTLTAPGTYTFTLVDGTLQVYAAPPAPASASGSYLYAASASADTVTGYTINPTTGVLTAVPGSPFPAGALPFGPSGITVDPSNHFVYVADANVSDNAVLAFTISGGTGSLSAISGSPFAAGGISPGAVTVDPAGKFLYVANQNSNDITVFSIDPGSGAMAPLAIGPFATGSGPQFNLAIHPSGKFLYLPYSGNTPGSGSLSGFSVDPVTGGLTPLSASPFSAGTAPDWVAIDPLGRFLYAGTWAAASGNNLLYAFSVDQASGNLTAVPGSPFTTGAALPVGSSVPFAPQGQGGFYSLQLRGVSFGASGETVEAHLYDNTYDNAAFGHLVITDTTTSTVLIDHTYGDYGHFGAPGYFSEQFVLPYSDTLSISMNGQEFSNMAILFGSVNVANGGTFYGQFPSYTTTVQIAKALPQPIAVDPRGRYLFIGNQSNGTTSAFAIDQDTGAVTAIAGSPFTGGGASTVLDPTGSFLYSADSPGANTIAGFQVNQSTGALTRIGSSSFPSGAAPLALATALATAASTTTAVISSFNPSIFGQPTTFTAAVTANGSPATTGTVMFLDGATAISGAITLNNSGMASFMTNGLAAGSHNITAAYSGSANFGSSDGVVVQTVTTTITAQPQPALPGLNSTFTGGNGASHIDTFVTPYQVTQDGFITSWQTEYWGQAVTQGPVIPAGVQLKVFRQTPSGIQAVASGPVDDPRPILQQRFGAAYPNFPYAQSLVTFNDPPLPVKNGDFVGITIYAATPPGLYEYPMVGPAGTLQVQRNVVVGQSVDPTDPQTFSLPSPPALNFTLTAAGALNPLNLQNNYFVTGDYSIGTVAMRGTGVNGTANGTITIPSSSQDPVNGVPNGADIIGGILYWQTLENTATASAASVVFNGFTVGGQQIGSDLAYTDGAFSGTLRMYRADVNAYLPVANTTNGVRIGSGSFTVSLPDSGGTGLPLAEGASLVMIYRVLSPSFPLKSVVILDGSATPTGAGVLQTVQGFYDPAPAGAARVTNLYTPAGGSWGGITTAPSLQSGQSVFNNMMGPGAWGAIVFSTPVNSSDGDGLLDAWKTGPPLSDFHAGQPGYYAVNDGSWVPLPGAQHGQKDLFVQIDYMCGAVLADGSCDPTKENLFPSPDTSGNDPVAMVTQAFLNRGIHAHFVVGNAIPEDTCTDNLTTNPPQLCEFPVQPVGSVLAGTTPSGVVSWKNSLEFYKAWPRNLAACISGGDCTPRFPVGQKDSYHYVLFAHALAVPAWNSRFGSISSITVSNGVTTIVTADRGNGLQACPSRITISGVLGNPALNGVYNVASCADTRTMTISTPGVRNWTYSNATLEPVLGITSGVISSISGYSDLGGADSAITLGLWETAPNQDMSKRANVTAGTLFHEIGHTLGLPHGGLYFDTPGSFAPTFEANCKPNYQSIMNYLFQLDLVGTTHVLDYSGQTVQTLNEQALSSVTQLVDGGNNPAAVPSSAWYVPVTPGTTASPATRHCDGTPLTGDSYYRVDAPVSPITPAWTNNQDINFDGHVNAQMRGYNDWAHLDLRQLGATGGEYTAVSKSVSFASGASPINVAAGGTVALGSGGNVILGSGGNVTLGSGGNVTLGSGGTIALGSGGNITLGSGGNVTLGSGGTVTPGADGNVTLGSGGNLTLSTAGTITLGSGGTVTVAFGGTVTLGSGGTIALGSGGNVVLGSGGQYTLPASGGTITLGSGGNVILGSGGNVTLGSGGNIVLGSGGNVTLGSGGNVTLGSGGNIALGSGGNVILGSGGNVTLGSGGTITLGSGGNVTLGSGGNVTLGSGGTVTLGSGGNVALGSGGNVILGSGGTIALGAGGTVALGSGGNVTLGSGGTITLGSGGNVTLGSGGTATVSAGGNVTLGSGGNIALGSGGNVILGSGGNVTLGSGGTITLGSGGSVVIPAGGSYTIPSSGGTIALGSGGNVTLGSGGTVALGSGGNVTLGSGGTISYSSGGTVALGSGGNVTLGSGGLITLSNGGNVTLGSGGNVALGSGGLIVLGSGGNVTLGSGGTVALGSGGSVTLGSGGNTFAELDYDTANSVARPPVSPTYTLAGSNSATINWSAPEFGVVATYVIYRVVTDSHGVPQGSPVAIGSVSGVNGFPPATTFTDPNVPTPPPGGTVQYTITTTLVPDQITNQQRQSAQSTPAVLTFDQTITLGPVPSSVKITDAPITITATAKSGGNPDGLQVNFSASGQCSIGSQTVDPSSGTSTATLNFSVTGKCTITASQAGQVVTASTAYNAAKSVSASFAILANTANNGASQTISFAPIGTVHYGSTFTPSATSSSGLALSFTTSGPCTPAGTVTGVGVCQITASQAGNSNFSPASVTQSFNIVPAVLTVAANNLPGVYGLPLPALTYAYSGFVNGDTAAVISGAPALSTTATSASGAGSYHITVSQGTLAAANYDFLYVNGTLTIAPANLTVTAASGAVPYGGPLFPVTPGYSGFVNGDGVANLTTTAMCSTTATSSSNAGTYPAACSGASSANYTISYTPGVVTVAPATTSITVASSVNPSSYFQMVTFTAYVCPQFSGVPTGSVTFYNNGSPLNGQQAAALGAAAAGTPACSNGVIPSVATFSTTSLPAASNSITATYSGDSGANGDGLGNFSGSTAPALAQVVLQAPVVQLSPLYVAFGNQNVNTTSMAAKVKLSNIGNTALAIYGISIAGSNANEFAISSNTCGSSVAAGGSCTVTVTFKPVDTGLASASLQVFDNDENNSSAQQLVALSGAGVSTISGPGSMYTDAIFAGANSCGTITLSGNSSVNSFNSAQGYAASHTNSGGNVATNGNVTLNGSNSNIYGSAAVPSTAAGKCSSSAVTGLTSNGGGQVTGGLLALSAPVSYPATPAIIPAPPTTNQSISGSCPSGLAGCTNNGSKSVSLAPGLYGNLSVSGGTTLHVSKGTYNLNSLVLSGGSVLHLDSGPVLVNLAGAALSGSSPALDLSGGSMENTSGLPGNLQFTYGGSRGVTLSGGANSFAAVYAPNAVVNMSGGTDFFGSIIAGTLTSSGGTALHYDRALPNIAAGNYIWFAAVVNNVNGLPSGSQAKVYLTDASIQYSVNGVAQPPVAVPNAVLTFNSAAFPSGTGAVTSYDLVANRWSTAIGSKSLTGNTFVTGIAIPVPAGGFPTGIQNVQFSAAFSTDVSGLTFNWQWGAAAYTAFGTTYANTSNNNLLGVNPEDGSADPNGADIAGAPESYKASLVAGGTGSGGTNYVGFLSTSSAVVPVAAPVTANPSNLAFAPQAQGITSAPLTAVITNADVVAHNFVIPQGATSPIYIAGTNSGDFALSAGANNCVGMTSLAAGASCTIYVTFTPSLHSGAGESAKVVVNNDAKNSPQTVYVAGSSQ